MLKVIYKANDPDIRYKTGFSFSDPVFFVDTGKKQYLYLDDREFEMVKKENRNPKLRVFLIYPYIKKAKEYKDITSFKNKVALAIIQSLGKGKKITVSEDFSIAMADFLRKKGIKISVASELYPEREVKTKKEVAVIENILKRMLKAFDRIESIFKKSAIHGDSIIYQRKEMTSAFLKQEIDLVFMKNGLRRDQENIVSSGKDTAIPHHRGEGKIRPNTPIVVDLFPRDEKTGYFGDMTRTYVKGKPSEKVLKMYEATLEAQKDALQKIKAGVKGSDVHKSCQEVFKKNGFETKNGEGFVHATGHGLGLELHEKPTLGGGDEVLKEGNVVTVEPGLYYPKIGGIRIEDVVVVTKKGYKNLTNCPHNFIIP